MLELRGITAGYGKSPVIHEIDLTVQVGEIVVLVGANGAGKSTLVKSISGLLRLQSGQIHFEGNRIDKLSPRARMTRGIAHVPEGRQTFTGMTVAENLELGGLALRARPSELRQRMENICATFPVLRERFNEIVVNFSGGQHQMLSIARGLMANPKLLILDEPSLGLSPALVAEVFRLIIRLRDQGVSILLSEQNARLALAICKRGYVIENGRVAITDEGSALLKSSMIIEKYLGGEGIHSSEASPHYVEMVENLRGLMNA